jgi:gamma-glutamylcyclotransferase (GGCT)/AIG2-like uncharacterized protein YtfP
MTQHCFAYGSLMCDDIMAAVCGVLPGTLTARPASVRDFVRHPVVGESYPGMVPGPTRSVTGIVYLNLPFTAWARLDAFEGEMYERQLVMVRVAGGASIEAETYVFRPQFAYRLAPGDWDFTAFMKEGKARFTTQYLGFDKL